jgi:hypothetical protein
LQGSWKEQSVLGPHSGHGQINCLTQFFQGERFKQQGINRSERLTKNFVFFDKGCGHDDGLIRLNLSNAGNQLIALHPGHGEISYNHVKPAFCQLG